MKKFLIIATCSLIVAACTSTPEPFGTDEIVITSPQPNALVGGVIEVTGKARGSWYFEANFPLIILDATGEVLAESYATAQGEWMTTEFVSFVGTLEIEDFYQGTGTLIIMNANASGLPENDKSLEMPIDIDTLLLTPQEKVDINDYITEHINELSSVEPVLGGTFYVTNITWSTTLNEAIVEYEDGHIAVKAKAIIGMYANGDIILDEFVPLDE